MKKRALCALVSLALCVTLAGQAAAAESSVSFVVNGITLAADVPNRVEARTTYVSYWPIVSALYPNATAEWVNGQAEVKADGLTLHIKPGAQYVEANGRYLYVPDGVKCEGYSIMVPIRTLCQALGAGVEWDGTQSTIQITSGSGAGCRFNYKEEPGYYLQADRSQRNGTTQGHATYRFLPRCKRKDRAAR